MPRRNNRPERAHQKASSAPPVEFVTTSAADELEALARGLVRRGLASTNILDRPCRDNPTTERNTP